MCSLLFDVGINVSVFEHSMEKVIRTEYFQKEPSLGILGSNLFKFSNSLDQIGYESMMFTRI